MTNDVVSRSMQAAPTRTARPIRSRRRPGKLPPRTSSRAGHCRPRPSRGRLPRAEPRRRSPRSSASRRSPRCGVEGRDSSSSPASGSPSASGLARRCGATSGSLGLWEVQRRATRFTVTNNRLVIEEGLVKRVVSGVPLTAIQHVLLRTGPWDGTVEILAPGVRGQSSSRIGPLGPVAARRLAAAITSKGADLDEVTE